MQGKNILVLNISYFSGLNTSRECQELDFHRERKTEGTGRKRRPKERWSVPNYELQEEDTGDIDTRAKLVLDEGKPLYSWKIFECKNE
jgi:hypothetical protein